MQDKVTPVPRMYRVKAVAEMFDVSVSMIYRAIEAGQLEALKIGTGKGSLRISEQAIAAFKDTCVLSPRDAQSGDCFEIGVSGPTRRAEGPAGWAL